MQRLTKQESRLELSQPFFSSLPYAPDRTTEIRKVIEKESRYHDMIEWRISTSTVLSVEPIEVKGGPII